MCTNRDTFVTVKSHAESPGKLIYLTFFPMRRMIALFLWRQVIIIKMHLIYRCLSGHSKLSLFIWHTSNTEAIQSASHRHRKFYITLYLWKPINTQLFFWIYMNFIQLIFRTFEVYGAECGSFVLSVCCLKTYAVSLLLAWKTLFYCHHNHVNCFYIFLPDFISSFYFYLHFKPVFFDAADNKDHTDSAHLPNAPCYLCRWRGEKVWVGKCNSATLRWVSLISVAVC